MILRNTISARTRTLKFLDWQHLDRSWVLLYRIDSQPELKAWSNYCLDEGVREMFISKLIGDIESASPRSDLFDIFLNRTPEWSYWGSGIPEPIADFYDSDLKCIISENFE